MRIEPRRRVAWTPLCVPLMLYILAGGARASDENTDFDFGPVDTVRVGADYAAGPDEIARLPFFASVIDLEEETGRLRSIADILEEAAGVRVRRFGSLGSYAVASVRGSAPGQVEIYLDGVPLNSAQWGTTNLSELAVDNLVRAEIYRSGAPARFGAPGIGGVVNLVTRPAGRGRTSLSLTGGSYDTWKSALLRSGRIGPAAYLVTYRQLQTKGNFDFLYDPGTRFQNSSDDTLLTRQNNRFQEHAFLGKLILPPLRGWSLSIQDDWFLKESGLPGHGNLLYEEASFDNRRHLVTASLSSPGFLGRKLQAELTGFHVYRRDRYYNPANEPGLSRNDLVHRASTDGGNSFVTFHWLEAYQRIRAGAEIRKEKFTPEEPEGAGAGFTRTRDTRLFSAEDEISILRDRLTLLAAWRYQESEDNFHGYLPYGPPPEARDEPFRSDFRGSTFGVRAEPARFLTLKASRSAQGRFPTLLEIFGTGGDMRPNPDLVPERGVTWDGGLRLEKQRGRRFTGSLELSAFHSERDSLIYFIQNSQQNFKAVNLENAVAKGIEMQWSAEFFRRFGFDGSFTTQDVRHHGEVPHWDGRWLPYISPRELFIRTSLRAGRWTFRHELTWLDRYYRDRANIEEDRAAARTIYNVGAKVRFWRERLTLDLDVQNVGDNKTTDSFGYPMPGRTIYLTAQIDFQEKM